MILGSAFLIILYLIFRYIIAWITYYNNLDPRLGESTWRFTYDYPVVGERELVVVLIGASSVPPYCMKLSLTCVSRSPRHKSSRVSVCPPPFSSSCAPTARSLLSASRRSAIVAGNGCGVVRVVSRSGSLSTRYAAIE